MTFFLSLYFGEHYYIILYILLASTFEMFISMRMYIKWLCAACSFQRTTIYFVGTQPLTLCAHTNTNEYTLKSETNTHR